MTDKAVMDLERKYSVDGLIFKGADYAVFIVLLCIAGGFGVYSGIIEIRNKKRMAKDSAGGKEATMGSRDLGVIPVSFRSERQINIYLCAMGNLHST